MTILYNHVDVLIKGDIHPLTVGFPPPCHHEFRGRDVTWCSYWSIPNGASSSFHSPSTRIPQNLDPNFSYISNHIEKISHIPLDPYTFVIIIRSSLDPDSSYLKNETPLDFIISTMWGPRSIAKLVYNSSNYDLWYL